MNIITQKVVSEDVLAVHPSVRPSVRHTTQGSDTELNI